MDAFIEQRANETRFMMEVWLNVQVTTMVHYDLGWTDHVPAFGDLTEITAKYRAKEVIK